jgi:cytochrome P450
MGSRSATGDQIRTASARLNDYLAGVILDQSLAERGLLQELARSEIATGQLTIEEAVGMARTLLRAGHENTAQMISLGTLVLLEHPDQLARLRADTSLYPSAVEEIVRYLSTVSQSRRRIATEDCLLGGQEIKAGEGIIILQDSANRDSTYFSDADAFDISRDSQMHLAFGYGVHYCLGQVLARMELVTVFEVLFGRLPGLRLAVDIRDLSWRDDSLIYGPISLPVTW